MLVLCSILFLHLLLHLQQLSLKWHVVFWDTVEPDHGLLGLLNPSIPVIIPRAFREKIIPICERSAQNNVMPMAIVMLDR